MRGEREKKKNGKQKSRRVRARAQIALYAARKSDGDNWLWLLSKQAVQEAGDDGDETADRVPQGVSATMICDVACIRLTGRALRPFDAGRRNRAITQ